MQQLRELLVELCRGISVLLVRRGGAFDRAHQRGKSGMPIETLL